MDIRRIERIKHHQTRWQGPISVAVLLTGQDIPKLTSFLDREKLDNVTVHMCVASFQWPHYPINFMRNVALRDVKTKWSFVLDTDEDTVFPMTNYQHEVIRALAIMPSINLDKSVFAVTSWQWGTEKKEQPPTSVMSIKTRMAGHVIDVKAPHFRKAYTPPSITPDKWFNMDRAHSTRFGDSYEPYYIVKTGSAPPFDPRFRGWGANKSIQTFTMAVNHYKFIVLPNVFTFVDDTPSRSWDHSPPPDPEMVDQAWKEMGAKHGCSTCDLWSCIERCPSLLPDEMMGE
jgi:hypothetical protein